MSKEYKSAVCKSCDKFSRKYTDNVYIDEDQNLDNYKYIYCKGCAKYYKKTYGTEFKVYKVQEVPNLIIIPLKIEKNGVWYRRRRFNIPQNLTLKAYFFIMGVLSGFIVGKIIVIGICGLFK